MTRVERRSPEDHRGGRRQAIAFRPFVRTVAEQLPRRAVRALFSSPLSMNTWLSGVKPLACRSYARTPAAPGPRSRSRSARMSLGRQLLHRRIRHSGHRTKPRMVARSMSPPRMQSRSPSRAPAASATASSWAYDRHLAMAPQGINSTRLSLDRRRNLGQRRTASTPSASLRRTASTIPRSAGDVGPAALGEAVDVEHVRARPEQNDRPVASGCLRPRERRAA